MVYHLLNECFSTRFGVALSRLVASFLASTPDSYAVCPAADGSWNIPSDRVHVSRRLLPLTLTIKGSKMRGWRYLPESLRNYIAEFLFSGLLSRLKQGDIVWCHNWPYVADALALPVRRRGARLVLHVHNSLAPYATRRLFRRCLPDAIIFNSEAMRSEACSLMPLQANSHVVHNGVDDQLFFPPSSVREEQVPVVLFVGRLVAEKGAHVLLKAIHLLNQQQVACLCRIAGSAHAGAATSDSAYIRSLREMAPDNVEFVGFRSAEEVAAEYRRADIFCCPSTWQEPFGLVNIEAMASGLPVVASRVGGIPEIASGGGFALVEPNSPEQLADALRTLLLDAAARADLGSKAYASFQHRFTVAMMLQRCSQIAGQLPQVVA